MPKGYRTYLPEQDLLLPPRGAFAAQVCGCGEGKSERRRGHRNGHAHGRVVFSGSPRTATEAWSGRTCRIAPRTCAAVGGGDLFGVREVALATAAEKRAGRGRELHLKYVDETAAVFRSRRGRVVQQCSGELDAAGNFGEKELVARRQPEVRTQGRSFRTASIPKVTPAMSRIL